MKMKTVGVKHMLPMLLASVLFLVGCGTSQNASQEQNSAQSNSISSKIELTILAAASLTDAMNELASLYRNMRPDVKITYAFGASGALQMQIEQGAPADVFFSAAQKQMDTLAQKGFIDEVSRTDLLENKVVLIVPKESEKEIETFEDILDNTVERIALGEPGAVPVGQYAEQVFTSLGILDTLKASQKVVYGSDVRQVLTWVESGEVDCGVVYATDAAVSSGVNVVCEAQKDSCDRIVYPAGVIKSSKYFDEATSFLAFLSSEEARVVFEQYGFTPV